jgi:hypothetical protein
MTPKRRDLILQVANDRMDALSIIHPLCGFVHADAMFEWMIKNKMVGDSLIKTFTLDFHNSWLSLGKWVIMKASKDQKIRKVIAGKDYLV